MEVDDVEGDEVKGEEDDDDEEENDVEEEADPMTGTHALHENLQVKCRRPRLGSTPGTTLCASLRSRNTLRHFTRATFCEFTGKRPGPKTGTHTLREKAQSKCTWILEVKCLGPAGAP